MPDDIQFKREAGQVTLVMSEGDYDSVLLALAIAAATALGDKRMFCQWIELVNRLNAGNPQFTPYEIPADHRGGKLRA